VHLPVELLAPAGSPEAARAAVQNGADAIYLGGKQFSARQYAENFGDEELLEILRYCRIYGVKVYVTVNTLVHDEELDRALEYLHFLYNAGVDAVIMQDTGLMRCTAQLIPGLSIHASTQMTIHNSEGILFLEEMGVQRVVLARELSLEDIRRIKERTDMELEIFIHGALCISYSGQCLLSSMIGGRSGNRGRCAQPCRLAYSLQEINTPSSGGEKRYSHLLSPKDLNLIEHLPGIIEAGVTGLKIEGRMKRPEYVAVVVRVYRQALDRYLENPDGYHVQYREQQELAQVFNREFTPGYLFGNPGQALMSVDRPNNRGVYLGRVKKVKRETGNVVIRTEGDLNVGDVIEFWVTSGGRKEITVDRLFLGAEEVNHLSGGREAQIKVKTTKDIHPGDRVFKTYDVELMSAAKQSFTSPVKKRKIPLSIKVELHSGRPMVLTGKDDLDNHVSVSGDLLAEEAVKRPLTHDSIRRQLDRLGNTPFELIEVDYDLGDDVILPLSEINKCRRKLVELLEEKRGQNPVRNGLSVAQFRQKKRDLLDGSPVPAQGSGCPIITVSVGDGESAYAAIESGAGRIYLGGEKFWGKSISSSAVESIISFAGQSNTEVYISLPRIWHENELCEVRKYVEGTLSFKPSGYTAGNLGSFRLLKSLGIENIHADYPLNIFNRQTAMFFLKKGADSYTFSIELNMQEMEKFGEMLKKAECVVHGWPPLMVSEHCVLSTKNSFKGSTACRQACRNPIGLQDRLNLTFPVKTDTKCRMYVYNSKELCLIENLSLLASMGIKYFRIEAKIKDAPYVARVVSAYNRILGLLSRGINPEEEAVYSREELEKYSPQGITKGHYFRGV
jgi:putative protease